MRERLVIWLATGLGVGRFPWGPGTVGSILGVGYWWLLLQLPGALVQWTVILVGVGFGVWCTGVAARLLGRKDPGEVVLDEIVVLPVALALLGPASPLWQIAVGFLLFRVFDIWKPGPVRRLQDLPGGWGIVMDDLLAAVLACLGMYLVVWVVA